jgi:hypothetical protein
MRKGFLAVGLVLAATATSAGPRASGTFGAGDVAVEIVDAYAYPAKADFGDDEIIRVRLSTVPLDPAALDRTLDREGLLDTQAADSPSLKLDFDKSGRWTGSSYYLGSGNGCGYCSSPDAPGVAMKLEGGVLKGAIVVKASDHSDGKGVVANLKLAVPVASAVKAEPLGADGGDPGKAFTACVQATGKKDVEAFRSACGLAEDELAYHEREGSLDTFWQSGPPEALQLVNVKVSAARALGDEAELIVTAADGDGNKKKASVFMTRTPDGWRYRKANVESVY